MSEAGGALTPERWRQAEQLFQQALERSSAERDTFLDEACGTDLALRREVGSLLAADEQASDYLEGAVAAEAELMSEGRDNEMSGRKIGPYRLLRTLGRGGMSVVCLALRDDDQYRQEVAVKLLRWGMDTEEIARRFRQERQILAQLEHPAIARLLDGGTTEDGSPYLVMEHIVGRPVDQYCAEQGLGVPARLKLFVKVCSAVHYAHQNLVVHRDLKPSNILVTAEGAPKLLDFGIAKLLDPEQLPLTVVETEPAARIMTPEYASPEQIRGARMTTACDVYSLGVLLYEILTGRPPYRFDTRTPREIERIVCEEEAARPSAVVGRGGRSESLRRRLAGDLDTIVLRAMSKEPHRRYASVRELGGDLERHLAGLPVLARKDTWRYRTAKFVRRHRLGVTVAALVAATVVTSTSVTAWQARVARRAEARAQTALLQAEAEKDNAEEVLLFVEGLFDVADPEVAGGRDVTARELLELSAAQIATQLDDQPQARARLMGSMGRIHRHLGLYDEAVRLQEEALELWRPRSRPETVTALNELAETANAGRHSERAEKLFREALELGTEIWDEADEKPIADSLDGLGVALHRQGETEAAEGFLRRGLELRQRLFDAVHQDVARSQHNLGSLLFSRGELAQAEPLLRRSLAIKHELWGEEHPRIAPTSSNLAALYYTKLDYAAAESEYRRVLALRHKLLGDEHPALARTLTNLATVVSVRGRPAEALELHGEALARKYELFAHDHPSIAMSLLGLGKTLHALGRHEEAAARARESVELLRSRLSPDHRALAEPLLVWGRALLAHGEAERAEAPVREAVGIYRREFAPDARQTAAGESALAACLLALERTGEARQLLERAYPVLEEAFGDDAFETREARQLLPGVGLEQLLR